MRVTLIVVLLILLPPAAGFLAYYLTHSEAMVHLAWMSVVAILAYILFNFSHKSKPSAGYLGNEEDFLDSILRLASLVIQSDGKIGKPEILWVEKKLKNDFREKYVDDYITKFSQYLKNEMSLQGLCRDVNRDFDYPAKIQLLHFLINISAIDGRITDKEYQLFRSIAKLLRLNDRILNSILAMFNYRREKTRSKSYSNSRVKTSKLLLKTCYQILGIQENVTNKMVKRAFRKLAVIHHPDKVVHLGEKFQKSAVKKFQRILEAYEFIKTKRGFS